MRANPRTARNESMASRRFGTTDLAIVMGLWSAMAVLLGGVLSELASDAESPIAKAQTEAYALQLAEGAEANPKQAKSNRSPASQVQQAGALGKDPWGNAYQYRVYSNGVLVWSGGRNKVSDSDAAVERIIMGRPAAEFHFNGDDVGYLKLNHR